MDFAFRSYVSLGEKQRRIGVSGKNQVSLYYMLWLLRLLDGLVESSVMSKTPYKLSWALITKFMFQAVTNLKNTISQFKRFIGKKFSDPIVQEDIKEMQYEVVELPNDNIGIKVRSTQVLYKF